MGRRNDTVPPHPAVPWAPPASPAVGRGVLDCCLRRKDTKGHTQRSLGPCFRRDDTCWIPAYAGMTQWPPHPARPSALPPARPASPAVGRGVLGPCFRRDDTHWVPTHRPPFDYFDCIYRPGLYP